MTITSAISRPATRRSVAPVLAGIGFSLTWIIGLSIYSSSTEVRATGADVLAGYAGHQGIAAVQYVFTEGIAGLTLAAVVLLLARAARRARIPVLPLARAARRARIPVLVTGLVAATIALVQCGLGLYLTGPVVTEGSAGTAEMINHAISRLDGVKMFALAALAVSAGLSGVLPRWLRYVGVALAVAIIASGVGYLFLLNGLALAAWVSLPLLMVWVTSAGIVLGSRRHYL